MEIEQVTSSYTRKLNHQLYGGAAFESSDIFCALTASLDTNEDPIQAQHDLHTMCRDMVNKGIEDEIVSFAGGIPADQFYEYLRDLVARRPLDGNIYAKCNARQKAILQAAKRGVQMSKRDSLKVKN